MKLLRYFFPCFFKNTDAHYDHVNDILNWETVEREIVIEINKTFRPGGGMFKKQFLPDYRMRKAAQVRTMDFLNIQDYNHDGYPAISNYLKSFNLRVIGEVVGGGYNTAEEIVYAWKNSPEHFKVLNDTEYKYIGISRRRIEKNGNTIWAYCCLVSKEY